MPRLIKKVCLTTILVLVCVLAYYFFPESSLPPHIQIDRLVVHKSKRRMMAYADGSLIKTYTISLGKQPVGDKEFEGDFKTPEGVYYINTKNPNSGYHKNLGISYPDNTDIHHATKLGKPTGGDVKIHGLRNGSGSIGKFHRWHDWTFGCIAVTDDEIDELYRAVAVGTPIEILP